MARPKEIPREAIKIRLPEILTAELHLLRPELRDHNGFAKYGAFSTYIAGLIRQDLDNIKRGIQDASR